MIELWEFAACIVASVCLSMVMVGIFVKFKYSEAQAAIKKGMGALGLAGVEAKAAKRLEKSIANDLLNAQLPGIKALLGFISPETLELIEDNPEMVLGLLEKYKPLIEKFLPSGTGSPDKEKFDF